MKLTNGSILLFKLWNAAKTLPDNIFYITSPPLGWQKEIKNVEKSEIKGPIDWSKTFESRRKGNTGFVVKDFSRGIAYQQALYVAFVLEEFEIHCKIILCNIRRITKNKLPDYLLLIINEVEEVRIRIRAIINKQYVPYKSALGEMMRAVEGALIELIENEKKLGILIFQFTNPGFHLSDQKVRFF